jgi:TRAP-type C4-dicarboxylate transport system permease small subunit
MKLRQTGIFLLRVHDRICDGCYRVAAWMIFSMAVIMCYEVLVRYFFNRPTIWVADFTDYIMLYSTFFISAWLLKHDGHVRLTILYEHLSKRSRQISDMINSFIGAIVCGFVFWYSARDTWDAVKKSISLPRAVPVPKYLILGVISFGCLLLLVQFLRNGFKFLRDLEFGSKNEEAGRHAFSNE